MTEETQTESVETNETQTEQASASPSLLDSIGDGEGISFDFSSGEKPEEFPEDFWDAENKTPNVQALYDNYKKQEKRANDLRAKLGKGEHKAPKEASAYTVEFSDTAQPIIQENDPLVEAAKETAFKYGMSQEMFNGFINDMAENMATISANFANNQPQQTPEQLEEYKRQEFAKIGENAPAVIRAVESWGRGLYEGGNLSESDLEAFKSMATTGDQVRVLNKLRSIMGNADPIPMDTTSDSLPSDDEIADMLAEAYSTNNEKKVKEAQKLMYQRSQLGRAGSNLNISL